MTTSPEPAPLKEEIMRPLARLFRLIGLSLALVLLGSAWARDTSTQQHFLFRVQGQTNAVYLLGSVHFLRSDDYPLPDAFEDAYAEAEELYMELDMDDLDPLAIMQVMREKGMLGDGRSLRDLMGTKYSLASERAASIGVNLDMLAATKPWLAAMTILQLQLVKLGFDPSHGVEMYFVRKAQGDNKSIHGLETMHYQLDLFDGLSPSNQQKFLLQALEDAAAMQEEMDRVLKAWRMGDVSSLGDYMLSDLQKLPGVYESLVVQRNENWAGIVKELLSADKDYLVIVGAGHLAGEDSLINKLKGMGYQVRQL